MVKKVNKEHVAKKKSKDSSLPEEELKKIRKYPSVILKEIQVILDQSSDDLTPQEIFKIKGCMREKVKDLKKAIKKWVASYDK